MPTFTTHVSFIEFRTPLEVGQAKLLIAYESANHEHPGLLKAFSPIAYASMSPCQDWVYYHSRPSWVIDVGGVEAACKELDAAFKEHWGKAAKWAQDNHRKVAADREAGKSEKTIPPWSKRAYTLWENILAEERLQG